MYKISMAQQPKPQCLDSGRQFPACSMSSPPTRNPTPISLLLIFQSKDIPLAPTAVIPSSTIAQCPDPKVLRNPTTMPQRLTQGRETDSFRISSHIPEALHLVRRVRFHSKQRRLFPAPPGVTTCGLKLTIDFLMNLKRT